MVPESSALNTTPDQTVYHPASSQDLSLHVPLTLAPRRECEWQMTGTGADAGVRGVDEEPGCEE